MLRFKGGTKMSKGALSFTIVIVVASVGLSLPAFAKSGNSGGGQSTTATSSHAAKTSGGTNQTQSGNNQQSAGEKSKGGSKPFLVYTFKQVFTTKVSAETKPKTKPVVTGTITHRKAGGTQQ
jgi:hypothetical protein